MVFTDIQPIQDTIVVLTCQTFPMLYKALDYVWVHNGVVIAKTNMPIRSSRYHVDSNGSLIVKASIKESGLFECTVVSAHETYHAEYHMIATYGTSHKAVK